VLTINTHQHLEPNTSLPPLVLLLLVVLLELAKHQGELGSLEEERNLGMNTMKDSSKVLLSYLQYSSTYELKYSFHVIIMTYELVYSFYAMSLTCKTLCLIIHITCMIRSRTKLRWWFIMPSGVPMSYGCRSVGSESWGDEGSFYVIERGA